MTAGDQAVANAMVVVDGAWAEVRGTFYVQSKLNLPIDRLPDIGEAAVRARSERAAELLARIHQIDEAALPRELSLTLAVARITLARTAREGDLYWLAIDMLGIGFYGMFAPTAYCGGLLLGHLSGSLNRFRFDQQGDLYRYLGLVEAYGRLVTQMRLPTEGQAGQGIRMPVPQLYQAICLTARQAARPRGLVPSSA